MILSWQNCCYRGSSLIRSPSPHKRTFLTWVFGVSLVQDTGLWRKIPSFSGAGYHHFLAQDTINTLFSLGASLAQDTDHSPRRGSGLRSETAPWNGRRGGILRVLTGARR